MIGKMTIERLNELKKWIQPVAMHSTNVCTIHQEDANDLLALIDAAIARSSTDRGELLQNPQQVQAAIEIIQSNWPPENYTMLREALTLSIAALEFVLSQYGTKPETVSGCEGAEEIIMEELKPCPFCGGKAVILKENMYSVRCNSCFIGTDFCFTEQEAITAWNRRTTNEPV